MRISQICALLICVVILLLPVSAVYTEGDGGGNITPTNDDTAILPRRVTLPVGAVMVYEHYLGSLRFIEQVEVIDVIGTTIFFNITGGPNEGSHWTDVDAEVVLRYQNGTASLNYTYIGYGGSAGQNPIFIGGQVFIGPVYRGSPILLKSSVFGKIFLGQWRATTYYDSSFPRIGLVYHFEWDRQFGVMLSHDFSINQAGEKMRLVDTNLWDSDPMSVFVGNFLYFSLKALPYSIMFLALYLGSFLFVVIVDWMHMRSLKKKTTIQTGNMTWWYIKMMVIGILISTGIIAVIMFTLRTVLGLF